MHDTSRPSPEETRYRTAGVVAITAAVLQLPLLAHGANSRRPTDGRAREPGRRGA